MESLTLTNQENNYFLTNSLGGGCTNHHVIELADEIPVIYRI